MNLLRVFQNDEAENSHVLLNSFLLFEKRLFESL